jgi:hypothetical protein
VFVAGLAFMWAAFCLGEAAVVTGLVATVLVAAATALTLRGESVPFLRVVRLVPASLLAAGTVPSQSFRVEGEDPPGRFAGAVHASDSGRRAPEASAMLAIFRGSAYVFVNGGVMAWTPRGRRVSLIRRSSSARRRMPAPAFAGNLGSLIAAVRELSIGFLILPFAILLWTRTGLRRGGGGTRPSPRFSPGRFLMIFQKRVYYLAIFTAPSRRESGASCRFSGARS